MRLKIGLTDYLRLESQSLITGKSWDFFFEGLRDHSIFLPSEYMCHCYARSDGLSGVLISDHEYPNRVAHTFISKVSLSEPVLIARFQTHSIELCALPCCSPELNTAWPSAGSRRLCRQVFARYMVIWKQHAASRLGSSARQVSKSESGRRNVKNTVWSRWNENHPPEHDRRRTRTRGETRRTRGQVRWLERTEQNVLQNSEYQCRVRSVKSPQRLVLTASASWTNRYWYTWLRASSKLWLIEFFASAPIIKT